MSKDKDLTGLSDYSKTHPDEIPLAQEQDFLTDAPPEQVLDFEPIALTPMSDEAVPPPPSGDDSLFPTNDPVPANASSAIEMPTPPLTTDEDPIVEAPLPEATEVHFESPPSTLPPLMESLEPARAAPPLPASERRSSSIAAASATSPYSVLVRGVLPPEDQEKLVELLERENYGIRREDLEPQFRAGKILIPRVSEFAAILVVQTLRNAPVVMQVAPSDEIFATEDTAHRNDDPLPAPPSSATAEVHATHAASEAILLVTDGQVPGREISQAIDVVTASAGLKSMTLELKRSAEFTDTLEALKRELRHQALLKGAHAVTGFQLQIDRLDLPSLYRVSVTGTAVKLK